MRGEIAILLAPILILQVGSFLTAAQKFKTLCRRIREIIRISIFLLYGLVTYSSYYLVCFLHLSFIFWYFDIATYYGLETKKEIYRLCSFLLILTFLNGPIDLNVLQATNKFSQLKYFGIIESCGPLLAILVTILLDGSLL